MGDGSLQDVTHRRADSRSSAAAPEDAEVAGIVGRHSMAASGSSARDVVEALVPRLRRAAAGTSVINAEFKFDLLDFLAAYPGAPVHSLGAIIAGGSARPGDRRAC